MVNRPRQRCPNAGPHSSGGSAAYLSGDRLRIRPRCRRAQPLECCLAHQKVSFGSPRVIAPLNSNDRVVLEPDRSPACRGRAGIGATLSPRRAGEGLRCTHCRLSVQSERLPSGRSFPCKGVGDDESYGAKDGTGFGTILFALLYSHEGLLTI